MISCIFTHIPFSVNKSNLLFKGRSSINILQFNNVNFQIKRFVIFQKFLWNSVETIWGVIMNFIEITYTKIKYIIRTFPRIRRLSLFFIGENKTERNGGRSMLNQSKDMLCIFVSFQESRDSIKEEPETRVYDMFLSYCRTF